MTVSNLSAAGGPVAITSQPFTHDHLDVLRRAMLTDIADDMKIARRVLLDLRDRGDMAAGAFAEDALSTVQRLRLELDAMDALGWPNGEDR